MPTDDPRQGSTNMAVQGNTVHYACGIWRTAHKHEASVFGVGEFKPHHRGHGAYTWPPDITVSRAKQSPNQQRSNKLRQRDLANCA